MKSTTRRAAARLPIAAAVAFALATASVAHADAASDQIQQLQSQMRAMQQQLDALKASQDQQAAKAAEKKPEAKPSSSWADSTVVSGKAFVDASYIDQQSKGVDTDAKGSGIDVKRFYLGVDHKFDDVWSANLTTDFNYISADSETQVFIKKAYVQAQVGDDTAIRVGSADMPWIPFSEAWYGYRYVEQTLTDKNKFANSADWGVNLYGGNKGMVNYSFSVVNGGGFKNPTRSDSVDFEGRVGVEPIKGLMFAVGGYTGDRGLDVHSNPSKRNTTRFDALVAYKTDDFRVGAEYFTADDWNTIRGTATDKANGWSLWGNYGIMKDLNIFARYDRVKPKKDLDPTLRDKYFNFGLEWLVRKGIKIAGVYKYDLLDNDQTGSGRVDTKTDEIGVFAEIAF